MPRAYHINTSRKPPIEPLNYDSKPKKDYLKVPRVREHDEWDQAPKPQPQKEFTKVPRVS